MHTVKKLVVAVVASLGLSGVYFAVPIVAQDLPGWLRLPFMQVEKLAGEFKVQTVYRGYGIEREGPYSEEELAQVRGLPINPGDPDTLYLPPGIATLEQLPLCREVKNDPSTAVNEAYEAYLTGLYDGTHARNAHARLVKCRVDLDAESGFPLPAEEYEKWRRNMGRPRVAGPITTP